VSRGSARHAPPPNTLPSSAGGVLIDCGAGEGPAVHSKQAVRGMLYQHPVFAQYIAWLPP
jgi:hypothetical protein